MLLRCTYIVGGGGRSMSCHVCGCVCDGSDCVSCRIHSSMKLFSMWSIAESNRSRLLARHPVLPNNTPKSYCSQKSRGGLHNSPLGCVTPNAGISFLVEDGEHDSHGLSTAHRVASGPGSLAGSSSLGSTPLPLYPTVRHTPRFYGRGGYRAPDRNRTGIPTMAKWCRSRWTTRA